MLLQPLSTFAQGKGFDYKYADAEEIIVYPYSGHQGDERPVRFRLGGQEYFVEEVLDQWYGPHDVFFKVGAHDGNAYILRRSSSVPEGEWTLESFRDMRRRG